MGTLRYGTARVHSTRRGSVRTVRHGTSPDCDGKGDTEFSVLVLLTLDYIELARARRLSELSTAFSGAAMCIPGPTRARTCSSSVSGALWRQWLGERSLQTRRRPLPVSLFSTPRLSVTLACRQRLCMGRHLQPKWRSWGLQFAVTNAERSVRRPSGRRTSKRVFRQSVREQGTCNAGRSVQLSARGARCPHFALRGQGRR